MRPLATRVLRALAVAVLCLPLGVLPVSADAPDPGQVLVGVDDVPLGKGQVAVRLAPRVAALLHQRRAAPPRS